ncbi:MAG: NYN domain-containing protein [Paracoccaceae bacterium]
MNNGFAVLIDGDNVSASFADEIMIQAGGTAGPDLVRVYGNAQKCTGWLNFSGVRFCHAGAGKNAADLLLALDAMELTLERARPASGMRIAELGQRMYVKHNAKISLMQEKNWRAYLTGAPI